MICEEQTAEIMTKMPKLTVWTARLFLTMYERRNRITTCSTIEDFVPSDHAEYDMSRGAIASSVKRLRQQLRAMNCPITIKATYGLGYLMTVEGDWKPDHVLNPEPRDGTS